MLHGVWHNGLCCLHHCYWPLMSTSTPAHPHMQIHLTHMYTHTHTHAHHMLIKFKVTYQHVHCKHKAPHTHSHTHTLTHPPTPHTHSQMTQYSDLLTHFLDPHVRGIPEDGSKRAETLIRFLRNLRYVSTKLFLNFQNSHNLT